LIGALTGVLDHALSKAKSGNFDSKLYRLFE
jgi:hypothetical protein